MDFKTIESETEYGNVSVVPKPQRGLPEFTKEQFLDGTAINALFEAFGKSPIALETEKIKLKEQAKSVGIVGFASVLEAADRAHRYDLASTTNTTEAFEYPELEFLCGSWECGPYGVYRNTLRGRECACPHPILPVERLKNIDTGVVQYRLAFKRSTAQKRWQTVIVNASTISKAREITALSEMDISVTSSTASALVDFLNDVCNMNYDIIPETKSISRMGYIPGGDFMPFADGVVFDGDSSFRGLYDSIKQKGSLDDWCKAVEEIRNGSTEARIVLAASFASPVLSVVGSLPFFVHLWGGTGNGKSVSLMAAASVWGNPAPGSYVQTFNSTGVGQERTAAFLNHLPFCIDELQLTRDAKGKITFDVYQLAQGVGRSRGRRDGGIDAAPTWSCCFITTGESPIVSGSAGAGAVNRVIDIECSAEKNIVEDGKGLSSKLKQNYGHAGPTFVCKLYKSEEVQKEVREIYDEFFRKLCAGDSTEKQAMAAAVILTGDLLATRWIFEDDRELTVDDMRRFMASKESVSAGNRAYTWLRDWVASSVNHFNRDTAAATGEVYGELDSDMAYIIPSVFKSALSEAGFSDRAVLSYLREKRLIVTGKPDEFTKLKRCGGVVRRHIWLRLDDPPEEIPFSDMEIL